VVGVPLAAPLDEFDPLWLGPYLLLGRLGHGGMGTVYLGRHAAGDGIDSPPVGPLVAIKVIRPDLANIPEFRMRFEREARAAQRVHHAYTAAVLDVDTSGSRPYLVTEYIDGPTLSARVQDRGPLSVTQLEWFAKAVASALLAIHQAGLVHRDLKPGNILLSTFGARVIDFGIAHTLGASSMQTQGTIGTPAYMAPEQIRNQAITAATDVHAWGAVLVFAATGCAPFDGTTIPAIMRQVIEDTPDLASVPDVLRPLVASAMAKAPADRPAVTELLGCLDAGCGFAEAPSAATPLASSTATMPAPRRPAVQARATATITPSSPERQPGGGTGSKPHTRRSARRRKPVRSLARSWLARGLLVLLLALVGLSGFVQHEQLSSARAASQAKVTAEFIVKVNALVQTLSQERLVAATYVGSDYVVFRKNHTDFRPQVDQAYAEVRRIAASLPHDARLRATVGAAETQTDKLIGLRRQIDAQTAEQVATTDVYNSIARAWLAVPRVLSGTGMTDPEMVRSVAALTAINNVIEQVDYQRGYMALLLFLKRVDGDNLGRIHSASGEEAGWVSDFLIYADQKQRQLYDQTVTPAVDPVRDLQDRALRQAEAGVDVDVEGDKWLATVNAKIGRLRDVEAQVTADLTGRADSLASTARTGTWLACGTTALLSTLAAALAALLAFRAVRRRRTRRAAVVEAGTPEIIDKSLAG